MQEKDEFELNSEASFFEAIRCANIPDIVKFFRDENLKPWDFVYEDEFSGNKILPTKNNFYQIKFVIFKN